MSLFDRLQKTTLKMVNKTMGTVIEYRLVESEDEFEDVEIKGVFDNRYVEVNGVVSTHPVLRLVLEDLPRFPSVKDLVTIKEQEYKIIEIREDGFGGADIIMHLN